MSTSIVDEGEGESNERGPAKRAKIDNGDERGSTKQDQQQEQVNDNAGGEEDNDEDEDEDDVEFEDV